MNGFANITSPAVAAPDPTKHVMFNLGMVLGVDDFDQEFAYLSGRDQWLARDLIGYGTVCGLQVTTDVDARGPRIVVSPGVALNPRGQFIRVTPAQCAYLNDWLSGHTDDLVRRLGSPVGNSVPLYVTLCYRECPTDQVPIAGEPCRTESEATAASRLSDDFKLELGFDPPDQTEEEALRDFVAWLHEVQITEGPTTVSLQDFLNAIRAAGEPSSPVSPPDFMYGSPPESIQINSADACEYLRAAFRLWTTELRARWSKNDCDSSAENCVLLAQLDVPLVSGWQVDNSQSVVIDEEHRPYLIHLRLLQEWVLCGRTAGESRIKGSDSVVGEQAYGQAPSSGLADTFSRGDHTHGTPTLPPFPPAGDTVASETGFGQTQSAGVSIQYSRADHTHGTPAAPSGVAPSGTVASETAFGQAANPGLSANFSRGDHTHGTPALPPLPGPGNTVTSETGFGQAANAGASASFSRADHTHGTPALPPVPAPGGTVTPETAFGQASNPGASASFSRTDHTHGTPALPPIPGPGNTVASETAFGQPSNAGASANFSRADHTHGTPVLPIIAGGRFDLNGNPDFATNGLNAKAVPQNNDLFFLTFNTFKPNANYVVKGTTINTVNNRIPFVFEVLLSNDPALIKLLQSVGLLPNGGIVVRLAPAQSTDFQPAGFMVEISQF